MDILGSFAMILGLLAPMIIFYLIFMDGYKTKVNSEKIIAQNEEIIKLLKQNQHTGVNKYDV
ncbi:hypothetical protein ACMGE7_02260 [Macrococcus equi]|uniref:hypothetical protein n=1 Tax=Macrococcus equi TaxID=3395462 RepID=UPI0039BDDC78